MPKLSFKYMPHLALFIIVVLCVQLAKSTPVMSCESGIFPEVNISGCDQQPCVFYIGSDIGFVMKFNSPRYLEHIKPTVIASVAGLDVPYPFLNQDDACEGIINTPCPLAEEERVEYQFAMHLSPIFPETSLTMAFAIVDLDLGGSNVVCFKTQALIKKP